MPRLRVLAGTSLDALEPITDIVNTGQSRSIHSDHFEGKVAMYIHRFLDAQGRPLRSEYFERKERTGITWSIQVQGRFLQPYSANDILFGNTFDRPLKLPWGAGAALQFMKFVDPALQHDLKSSTKPWALSPLIVTVPYFVHARTDTLLDEKVQESSETKSFPPSTSISDHTSQLRRALVSTDSLTGPERPRDFRFATPADRRKYFTKEANRKALVFGPNDLISIDFCYGFIEFSPDLALRLPGGITFDLTKYWDGQPVRFVCCERRKSSDGSRTDGEPIGKLFWCISIELVDEEASENVDVMRSDNRDDSVWQDSTRVDDQAR